jgi:hypothetical protein
METRIVSCFVAIGPAFRRDSECPIHPQYQFFLRRRGWGHGDGPILAGSERVLFGRQIINPVADDKWRYGFDGGPGRHGQTFGYGIWRSRRIAGI